MQPHFTAVLKQVYSAETSATQQCCLQAHTQLRHGQKAPLGQSRRAKTDDQPLSARYAACSCNKQNKLLTISDLTAISR